MIKDDKVKRVGVYIGGALTELTQEQMAEYIEKAERELNEVRTAFKRNFMNFR